MSPGISKRTVCVLASGMLLTACPPKPIPQPDDERVERVPSESIGEPVAIPAQWDDDPRIGCVAVGDTREIHGTVKLMDLGRGREGAVIDDGTVKWVVSYTAEDGVLEDFDGVEVLARGRKCEKQGQAVQAWHFQLRSLRAIGD